MPEATYSIDRDLQEAKALADHLIPYVYENELYGSVGGMFGSSSMPRLTIGGLLERLHRLHALEGQLSAAQKAQLSAIDAQKEKARTEWTVHYNDKLVQEANSRLKMIEHFFSECDDEPRTCAASYPAEANRRTVVEDILHELDSTGASSADVKTNAGKIDSRLHRYAQPSDFIRASVLQAAYPKDEYWWLYATPPKTGNP